MKAKRTILVRALMAALLLWSFNAGLAFSGEEPGKGEGKHVPKAEKLVIPKTLPAVWGAVAEHQKELHEVLAAKKLADVHHHAFAVRDLVAALPAKSAALPTEKKTSLGKSVSRVASLAKLLDEAGDAGDSAKVATLVVKLDAELMTIESLYPAKDIKQTQGTADAAKQVYACPMHAEVTSDKPGDCTKCGMKLTMKEAEKGSMQNPH
ncbi:MAG: heavy metal-binding domain-containing protein [Candidatus Zixiibacteriota bacterium]